MVEATELTPAAIRSKTFSSRWRGFAPLEVKTFLDWVAEVLGAQQQELAAKQEELERLNQEVAGFKKREQLLKDTLINAQQVIEAMKVNAQKEGELIVHEAEIKAEKILQEAFQRQARIKEDITTLQRLRAELKVQLQGLVDRFQKLVQEIEGDGTAA